MSATRELDGTILIADDDPTLGRLFKAVLTREGYAVEVVEDGSAAKGRIAGGRYDLILLDLTIGPAGGVEILEHARRVSPATQVVIITGHATVESAVETLKKGAHDYLVKPVENERLTLLARRALEIKRLDEENRRAIEALALEKQRNRTLLRGIRQQSSLTRLFGNSDDLRDLRSLIAEVIRADSTVLIQGESGTGKSLLARTIHYDGPRAERPFIEINCAVYDEGLLMSELFGHESGAFTGATRRRKGRFELAEGGTVFLDEIGDMPASAQLALLRFLQERCFERVGGEETITADVRVIAATNRDLTRRMTEGLFREDLFYRLNVIPITLPPLRERAADIPALAEKILRECSSRMRREAVHLSTGALDRLVRHTWPGNIRELQNVIERAMLLCRGDTITEQHLAGLETPPSISAFPETASSRTGSPEAPVRLEDKEREHILSVLEQCRWNKKRAASVLGINRSSLYSKLKRLGIQQACATMAAGAGGRVQDPDS